MADDGFESGINPIWTQTTTGGTITAIAGAAKVGSYGCRMTTDGSADNAIIKLKRDGMNEADYDFSTWVRSSDVGDAHGFYMQVSDTGAAMMAYIQIYSNQIEYGWPGSGVLTFATVPANNTWYKIRIAVNNTTNICSIYLYDNAGGLLESDVDNSVAYGANVESISYDRQDRTGVQTTDLDETTYGPAPPSTATMTLQKVW